MDILSIAIAKKLSQGAVAELLAASPDTVKALQNLVAALNDDPSYAESITTEIGEVKDDVETLGTEVESLTEQISDLAEKVGAAEDGEDGGYNKHDTEENWNKATGFIPKAGEIIIYQTDDNNPEPRMKIGDGATVVTDLPFCYEAIVSEEIDEICNEVFGTVFYTGDEVEL